MRSTAIVLTPNKPVPQDWFPPLAGKKVLCLACGGGQQGPILAATGADVTVFDNSPKQLERDRMVAEREQVSLQTELGDMRDLSRYSGGNFDVVLVTGTCFVDDITLMWREISRILKQSGILIAGCSNPIWVFLKGSRRTQWSMKEMSSARSCSGEVFLHRRCAVRRTNSHTGVR